MKYVFDSSIMINACLSRIYWIKVLAIEMFKIHTKTSSAIMQEASGKRTKKLNLQNQRDFAICQIKSVNYGLERILMVLF